MSHTLKELLHVLVDGIDVNDAQRSEYHDSVDNLNDDGTQPELSPEQEKAVARIKALKVRLAVEQDPDVQDSYKELIAKQEDILNGTGEADFKLTPAETGAKG